MAMHPPHARALDWDDLRFVLAVAERRSLAGAARALAVNHTTVLRRIAALEKKVGVRLFERTPAGYTPTPAGEEVAHVARSVDDAVVGVERRILGQDLRLTGSVRVTTTDTLWASVLPRHFAAFVAQHAEVDVELTVSNLLLSLSKRDVDVAIRPARKPPEDLIGRRIAELAFAVYATATHGRRRELDQYAWAAPGHALAATSVARWMARTLPRAQVAFRADSLLALREAVAAGLGVAALPCYLADPDPRLRRIHHPVAELTNELWLLVHPDLRRTARIRAFVDHMVLGLAAERDLFEGRRPPAVRARSPRLHRRTSSPFPKGAT